MFERQLEINRLYGLRQLDRTIFALGLQIGGEIGRNWFFNHVEALKQPKQRNEIVIGLEKVRQTKESMIIS